MEFYYNTQGKKQSYLICSFISLLIKKICYICRRQVFYRLDLEIGKEGFRTSCTSEASKYGWLFKKARLPIGNYIVHSRAKFSVSEGERRVTPGRIIESLSGEFAIRSHESVIVILIHLREKIPHRNSRFHM